MGIRFVVVGSDIESEIEASIVKIEKDIKIIGYGIEDKMRIDRPMNSNLIIIVLNIFFKCK